MKKAIHYINQFFGQIGGEDKADFEPEIREGYVGPGLLLNNLFSPEIEVSHTIICGDNFFGSRKEEAIERILGFLKDKEFDIFIAGPAFMAGRYGVACGGICKAVKEKFNVPVITSMYVENPGVEMYRRDIYIFPGGNGAVAMRKDMPKMANFAKKILAEETILPAEKEGYLPRGIRLESFKDPVVSGAERVVDMLLNKINGEKFKTEMPMPVIDRVPIANQVQDLSQATIALVNSGGIVPVGNPDRIQSASATKWGRYKISELEELESGQWETIHAGFDPSAANANPNRIVPLDALRYFEKEGKIGRIHEYVYSTVGTGTTQAEASRMGAEIAQHLKDANVSAVIFTSTWGTCTRCGATMTKEIERAGIPIVQMANLVSIAKTVGANRIVPTVSIPYPLGDPNTPEEEQWKLRRHRVEVALDALGSKVEEATIFEVKI